MNMFKKCRVCQETKHITEFSRNKRSKDGRMGLCRSCDNIRAKKYYEDHKEERSAYYKVYNSKDKKRTIKSFSLSMFNYQSYLMNFFLMFANEETKKETYQKLAKELQPKVPLNKDIFK